MTIILINFDTDGDIPGPNQLFILPPAVGQLFHGVNA